jgi:hypothetical protein
VRLSLDPVNDEVVSKIRYFSPDTAPADRDGGGKIAISGGRMWTVAPGSRHFCAVPLSDLQKFEDSDWGMALARERANPPDRGHWPSRYESPVDLLFAPSHPKLGPLPAATRLASPAADGGLGAPAGADKPTRYDVIPLDSKRVKVFQATDKVVRVTVVSITSAQMEGSEPKPFPTPEGAINVPFDCDFTAFEVGGRYYFLTASGALYTAKAGVKDMADAVAVWESEKNPLIGSIQYVSGKKVYVFGRSGPDRTEERFAFELSPKPVIVRYQRAAKPREDRADSDQEVYDCWRRIKLRLQP